MTKQIPLGGNRGKGKFALVDDDDYEWLSRYAWHSDIKGYATHSYKYGDSTRTIKMHRLILDLPGVLMVDHINRNKLDNQRANLRPANNQQNQGNTGPRKNKKGKYKGVSWSPSMQMWQAKIRVNGKDKFLGTFLTQKEAATIYNEEAKLVSGEYAYLNIIDESELPLIRKANAGFGASNYMGVKRSESNRWKATINVNYKRIHLGTFDNEEDAARAYDLAARKYRGERAKLNFQEIPDITKESIILQAPRSENCSSKYKGVYRRSPTAKWKAQISIGGNKVIYLGAFACEEDAARAHDDAALNRGGKIIYLNFPELAKP